MKVLGTAWHLRQQEIRRREKLKTRGPGDLYSMNPYRSLDFLKERIPNYERALARVPAVHIPNALPEDEVEAAQRWVEEYSHVPRKWTLTDAGNGPVVEAIARHYEVLSAPFVDAPPARLACAHSMENRVRWVEGPSPEEIKGRMSHFHRDMHEMSDSYFVVIWYGDKHFEGGEFVLKLFSTVYTYPVARNSLLSLDPSQIHGVRWLKSGTREAARFLIAENLGPGPLDYGRSSPFVP